MEHSATLDPCIQHVIKKPGHWLFHLLSLLIFRHFEFSFPALPKYKIHFSKLSSPCCVVECWNLLFQPLGVCIHDLPPLFPVLPRPYQSRVCSFALWDQLVYSSCILQLLRSLSFCVCLVSVNTCHPVPIGLSFYDWIAFCWVYALYLKIRSPMDICVGPIFWLLCVVL